MSALAERRYVDGSGGCGGGGSMLSSLSGLCSVRIGLLRTWWSKISSRFWSKMVSASRARTLSYCVSCQRRSLARTSRKRERGTEEDWLWLKNVSGRVSGWMGTIVAPSAARVEIWWAGTSGRVRTSRGIGGERRVRVCGEWRSW